MKQVLLGVQKNESIARDVYKMVLRGDTSALSTPGQFINIKLEGFYLRRPISVCDYDEQTITIIYKVVGRGTKVMSRLPEGETLDVLVGLGNGYDMTKSGERPLLIGGGAGVPPLYHLCKQLVTADKHPMVILGFNSREDVFYEKEFEALGADVYVATADGSWGKKGFVTDVMRGLSYTYFYACGPEAMFRAIDKVAETGGQYSFEERMGCGFGACMGCSCRTLTGYKRICKEGPVMEREEIRWSD